MKRKVVLTALLLVGILFSISGTFFFAAPNAVSAVSDEVTAPASLYLQPPNQLAETEVVYQKEMSDGTLWQAYGSGRTLLAIEVGDRITLTNAKGEVFWAEIAKIFTVPPDSNTRGETWIEFHNLDLALVRGQPASGPAVVFAFWRLW